MPKNDLDKNKQDRYRHEELRPVENRALLACSRFQGDVFLVSSEKDTVVPEETVNDYRRAFSLARSLISGQLPGADQIVGSGLAACLCKMGRELAFHASGP